LLKVGTTIVMLQDSEEAMKEPPIQPRAKPGASPIEVAIIRQSSNLYDIGFRSRSAFYWSDSIVLIKFYYID
jgi:hypothetical protein